MDSLEIPPVARAPVPQMVPDQRPTADAAALSRDPRPTIPLPFAAQAGPARGLSQVAEVAKSALRADTSFATDPSLPLDKRLAEVQRTLKPYGVSMLPGDRAAEQAKAAEQRADAAENAANRARAAATDARAAVKPEADEAKATEARPEAREPAAPVSDTPPEVTTKRPEPAAPPVQEPVLTDE